MKTQTAAKLFLADKSEQRDHLKYIHVTESLLKATNGHIYFEAERPSEIQPGIYTRTLKPAPNDIQKMPETTKLCFNTDNITKIPAKEAFTDKTLKVDLSGHIYRIKYPNSSSNTPEAAVYFEFDLNNGQKVNIAYNYALLMLQLDAVITGVYANNAGLRWIIPALKAKHQCFTMGIRL